MLKRAGALLAALLTLNVSAAEALRVCASAAKHANTAPVPSMEHAHHQMPESQKDEPCETPKPKDCCNALSSCGTSLVIDGAADDASVIPGREVSSRIADRAPASQVLSPDPPPPKV